MARSMGDTYAGSDVYMVYSVEVSNDSSKLTIAIELKALEQTVVRSRTLFSLPQLVV